ncbi:Leucine-rich repeat-containing protein 15-like protein [Dinothrombium tinctorium]|uniref:Leucine-rich repeat-containing protein 15-like protein n=1 Tax=Dinothrombium tinctorium TaxID=1965070 RepID=A0A443QRW8_9ACAR|nr:Leucine-rich repeat-containing protein 15-like protein [Dinothrombium tinctorium]
MTFYVILASLFIASVVSQKDNEICPKLTDIAPCACDREGFSCLKAKTIEDIKKAFQAPSKQKAARGFWLNGTPITRIPKNLFNDYKIENMYMEFNQIREIEDGAFQGSENSLQILSLHENSMNSFPFDYLSKFQKLHSLVLEINLLFNKLSEVGEYAFAVNESNNPALLTLLLAFNSISYIHETAFDNLIPAEIDLRFNSLRKLDANVFRPLFLRMLQYAVQTKSLPGVVLTAGNPFTCRGCNDYLWLVRNKSLWSNVLPDFKCIDGTRLQQLTLEKIGCY